MFKDKLKELREQKELSQYELADKLFVSRSTIAKWENGLGMPGKASMESLCEFFNVSKEELLKEDDPEIIINNIQKKSKKWFLWFLLLLVVFIPVLIYSGAFTVAYCIEMYNDTITPQDGKYYSEKYLKKFDLEGLDMIASTDIQLFQNSFYADIESYEVFDDYVTYVYNRLQYSTTISYLSNDSKIYNPTNKGSDIFLIPSTCLFDHIDEIDENGRPIKYEFYFFNDNTKRDDKDYVNFNYLELSYSNNSFRMYLDKSEIKDDSYTKAYLVNEYFEINKINLNNENIEKYLKFNINYDPQRINRASYITFNPYGRFILGNMESPNATPVPPYNLFVKVKMSLYDNDILVKEANKIFLSKYNTSLIFTCDDFDMDKDEFDKYQIKTSYEVLEGSCYYEIEKKEK